MPSLRSKIGPLGGRYFNFSETQGLTTYLCLSLPLATNSRPIGLNHTRLLFRTLQLLQNTSTARILQPLDAAFACCVNISAFGCIGHAPSSPPPTTPMA